jgi:hypothetical protein
MSKRRRKDSTESSLQKQLQIQGESPNELKMSVVFREFVAPWIVDVPDHDTRYTRYQLGMMAWNLAMLPPHLRPRQLANLLPLLAEELRLEVKALLMAMVARKEAEFADVRQLIQKFELRQTDDGYQLIVLSLPIQPAVQPPAQAPDATP